MRTPKGPLTFERGRVGPAELYYVDCGFEHHPDDFWYDMIVVIFPQERCRAIGIVSPVIQNPWFFFKRLLGELRYSSEGAIFDFTIGRFQQGSSSNDMMQAFINDNPDLTNMIRGKRRKHKARIGKAISFNPQEAEQTPGIPGDLDVSQAEVPIITKEPSKIHGKSAGIVGKQSQGNAKVSAKTEMNVSTIPDYLCHDQSILPLIRTSPKTSRDGNKFDRQVEINENRFGWKIECIKQEILGTKRPIEVYRDIRRGSFITPWDPPQPAEKYCPAQWADLKIGRGACGFRCRACFLILTHRVNCDPSRHVLYNNLDDYAIVAKKWLKNPDRKNLGLGIDCSDSLLYEGVTGHARRIIPLFADPAINPNGCKLILLTKSVNAHYLINLPTSNILLTYSLNPEQIADLWEGKWNDGVRITPPISSRLADSKLGAEMGFVVRWRIDPILPINGWEDIYRQFFMEAAKQGHRPERITLGSYRETKPALLTFSENWGLPPIEWKKAQLVKSGMHYHLPDNQRILIYQVIKNQIEKAWAGTGHLPLIGLCKEGESIHKTVGTKIGCCNCE